MPKSPFAGMSPSNFNIIKHRGDPTEAVTLYGDRVTKEEYAYFRDTNGQWTSVKCADYHGEHFVYLDPRFNKDGAEGKGHWFAMCTCGSPAVIVQRGTAMTHETNAEENMLVCFMYTATLTQFGVGKHMTSPKDIQKMLDEAEQPKYTGTEGLENV